LTGKAVKHQPDVIVWPETMFRQPLLQASSELTEDDLMQIAPHIPVDAWSTLNTPETLADVSRQAGTPMVIGLDTHVAEKSGYKHYNSAVFLQPNLGLTARYDKIHRIMFGEYIPLRDQFPWLYRVTPYSSGFGLDAGLQPAVFDCKGWRLAPIICFEDTVPHLVRNILNTDESADGGVDCLVNLTNDGWFHGSSELDQHLITASFRCVETRTPMVRAVNTGVSAIIDGDGVIVEPDVFIDGDDQGRDSMRDPQTGRWHKQLNATLVHDVPVDARSSLYLAYGDWFAGTCCFATIFLLVSGPVFRRKKAT
jgi:apolipoprotein N-acyltransferase